MISRERKRRFQFVEIDRYPTREQRKWYYILNSIDVGMTLWALNNFDNIKEGNIFLSNNPSNRALTNKQINDNNHIALNMNEPSCGNESYNRRCYYTQFVCDKQI